MQKRQQNITKALLAVYFVLLVWIILFKMQTNVSLFFHMGYRHMNLIPLKGSVIIDGKIRISEIILNVLIFVPFGIYISMLKEEWSFLQKTAPFFCTSLAFEILQYIFGIGATDITDLIGNTLGGMIGILLFELLSKLLKKNTIKILNVVASIGTVLITGLLFLLIAANL